MNQTLIAEVSRLVKECERLFFATTNLQVTSKGPKDYVTQVDLAVSAYLEEHLPALVPGSKVISEESATSAGIDAGNYWIIDPVDGTTNLIYGLPLYTISIGLLRNFEPVLGIVYNPYTKELFAAAKGMGAYLNGQPISVNNDQCLKETLVLAETNPYANRKKSRTVKVLAEVFYDCIDYRITGSAALDICYIASGRGGILFAEHLKTWDCAGGFAILTEAGGTYTNWQGKPFSLTEAAGDSLVASNGTLQQIALQYTRE